MDKKSKRILFILFGLLCFCLMFVSNSCGIANPYQRWKGNLRVERGKKYVIEYIKGKYGFEPEIIYTHSIMEENSGEFFTKEAFSGMIYYECKYGEMVFDTVIGLNEKKGYDNYQRDEGRRLIENTVRKIEDMNISELYYNSKEVKLDRSVLMHVNDETRYYGYTDEVIYEKMDLKQFLEHHRFRMSVETFNDLHFVDREAMNAKFPDNSVSYYRPFPKGEEWSEFPYQQILEKGKSEIITYAPRQIGLFQISTCDASDFSVNKGEISGGEWIENYQNKYEPIPEPIYICKFDGFKTIIIKYCMQMEKTETGKKLKPEKYDKIMYQFKDENGLVRNGLLQKSETVYSDTVILAYAKINEKKQ